MICANCGRSVTEIPDNISPSGVRLIHGTKYRIAGYFCYERGPEHAQLPVIHETSEIGDK